MCVCVWCKMHICNINMCFIIISMHTHTHTHTHTYTHTKHIHIDTYTNLYVLVCVNVYVQSSWRLRYIWDKLETLDPCSKCMWLARDVTATTGLERVPHGNFFIFISPISVVWAHCGPWHHRPMHAVNAWALLFRFRLRYTFTPATLVYVCVPISL